MLQQKSMHSILLPVRLGGR